MGIFRSRNEFFQNRFILVLVAVLCTFFWGNMIPAIKVGFDLLKIEPDNLFAEVLYAGLCFTLAGIFSLALPFLKEKRFILPKKIVIKDTIILGLVQTTLQYIFLYIGLSKASGFNSAVISSTGTFLIVILSHFLYKDDKINLKKFLGCLLGILGVMVLNFSESLAVSPAFTFEGEGMIFLSTLTFVFTTPLCKKISQYDSTIVFTGYSFFIGGIILIFFGVLGGGEFEFSTKGLAMIIYLAIAASVSGVLWNCLLEHNIVSKVTVYNFLVPIFGAASSNLMLTEEVAEWRSLISLILICLGIYFVDGEFSSLKKIINKLRKKQNAESI